MTMQENLCAAEAIIFAGGEGVSVQRLQEVLNIDLMQIEYIFDFLNEKYNNENSGIKFIKNSDLVFFTTNQDYAEYVYQALSKKKNAPLSAAAMETLAIIAYNQPVSRAFIEQVRGVDSTSSVQTLLSRNLIEEAGRLDIPGKPLSYKTTSVFLRSFSLDSLEQLPKIKSISPTEENYQLNLSEESEDD